VSTVKYCTVLEYILHSTAQYYIAQYIQYSLSKMRLSAVSHPELTLIHELAVRGADFYLKFVYDHYRRDAVSTINFHSGIIALRRIPRI
jgi:hypothetical protein